MKYAIMDNKGIIEDFNTLDEIDQNTIDRVREENTDIKGDLKVIEIHFIDN